MIKYCKCGCKRIVKNKYVKGHQNYKLKGISHIERFGKEKAIEINKRNSKTQKGNKRGSWEEQYGIKKANELKEKNSQQYKNKTNIEKFGLEKSKIISQKISKARTITKEKIIKDYIKLYDDMCGICKYDIYKIHKKDKSIICNSKTISDKFGSLDNLAKITNRPFKKPDPKIWGHTCRKGNNETKILDIIEIKNKIKLIRQFLVIFDGGYAWIDGYDKENNIAYEIDERAHKFNKVQDKIREENIKIMLPGIMFIRINEEEFLKDNLHLINNYIVIDDY